MNTKVLGIAVILLVFLAMLNFPTVEASPNEDFTTYTEVDPSTHINKTASHIDFYAIRNEDAYLYKDRGVAHFGDFEHKVDAKTVSGGSGDSCAMVWALANLVDDAQGIKLANDNELMLLMYGDIFYLRSCYLGTITLSVAYAFSPNRFYFLTIKRVGTAFTNKIYNETARITLLATQTITLNALMPSFRYIYGCQSLNDAWPAWKDCDIENLNLQELNVYNFYGSASQTFLVNPGVGKSVFWAFSRYMNSSQTFTSNGLMNLGIFGTASQTFATLSQNWYDWMLGVESNSQYHAYGTGKGWWFIPPVVAPGRDPLIYVAIGFGLVALGIAVDFKKRKK